MADLPPSPVRRAVVVSSAALVLLAAACTTDAVSAPPETSSLASTAPPGSVTPTTSPPATPAPSTPVSTPGTTDPAAGPEFLCQGAEQPRDTADAYTGALSSGALPQATACVYPSTVPDTTTQGLLVSGAQGSAYTLDESASSGSEFVYDGPQGRLTVTVTEEPDGHDWVTDVRQG